MRYIAALALVVSSSATAQVLPQPGSGDPRLQFVDYQREQVVTLEGAPGFQVTVELAPDEQVQNIALGDTTAWQVNANRAGNVLFVKATQTGADTNMTVITNARFYAFDLRSARGGSGAYEVRFRYPRQTEAANTTPRAIVGRFDLSGDRALRPVQMSDDGERTFIVWPEDAALPAVFFIDRGGREVLANGNMRGASYVIDSVHQRFLFRVDHRTAHAQRMPPEPRK